MASAAAPSVILFRSAAMASPVASCRKDHSVTTGRSPSSTSQPGRHSRANRMM